MILTPDISNQLKALVLDAIINEFVAKGHNLTGNGVKSLEAVVSEQITGITISILGEPYMAYQNEGRSAGKMPPPSSLYDWIKRRGIASDMKDVKRIAFAIALNMKRIGMHSDGASGKSGKPNSSKLDMSKRNYINTAIEKKYEQMTDLVFAGYEKNFTTTIETLYKNSKATVITV